VNDLEARRGLVDARLDAVRELLAARRAPAALLETRANFAWITAGGESQVVLSSEGGVAGLLVTHDRATVLTAVNEADRIADEELAGTGLDVVAVPWHESGAMTAEARRIAGADPLGDADLAEDLVPRRSVLAPLEVERMGWIGDRLGDALSTVVDGIAPGDTEHRIAAATLGTLGTHGIRLPVLLVAADERIARYRHPIPTVRGVERRVMVVAVAERWGLHVAVTRFAELEPPDDDLARRTAAADGVHRAMLAATEPGATFGDVLAAARRAYADAGFPDEWTLHHQGGSIGYQGRERIATPGDRTPIVEGMAFAWNPSIAGAKAEETFVLGPDGRRVLTGRGDYMLGT
jgi:Xaa-Pro dipeptidase